MGSDIHEEFVKSIRSAILDKDMAALKLGKEKVVTVLSDILFLGREAVYRRLRGEVKFSLEEVAQVALGLDISIDVLLGMKNKEKSVIELNFLDIKKDYRLTYQEKVNEQIVAFNTITGKFKDSSLASAFNRLPYTLFLHYKNISKFSLFKWGHQMGAIQSMRYKELEMSKELLVAQTKLVHESRKIKEANFILSPNVFATLIHDINYFHYLGLIEKDDVQEIKSELRELLVEMEGYAISGEFNTKSAVNFYISDLDLNFSSLLLRYGKHYYTYVNIYDLGGIESQNQRLCQFQDSWIKAQKKYSRLITQSNEVERHRFFRKQEEIIGE